MVEPLSLSFIVLTAKLYLGILWYNTGLTSLMSFMLI